MTQCRGVATLARKRYVAQNIGHITGASKNVPSEENNTPTETIPTKPSPARRILLALATTAFPKTIRPKPQSTEAVFADAMGVAVVFRTGRREICARRGGPAIRLGCDNGWRRTYIFASAAPRCHPNNGAIDCDCRSCNATTSLSQLLPLRCRNISDRGR